MAELEHYLAQLLILYLIVTPVFVNIFYQLFYYRNNVFFVKRRPWYTLIICVSGYMLASAETLFSPQYTLILTHDATLAKNVYYSTVTFSANAFGISATARYELQIFVT